MFPSAFDQENIILDKPDSLSDEQCESISARFGPVQISDTEVMDAFITCWKCTAEELAEINRTGRVWLYVYNGYMVPVALTGHNPFGEQS